MLRFLLPLMLGIIFQWYVAVPVIFLWITLLLSSATALVFSKKGLFKKAFIFGIACQFLFISIGAVTVWLSDISHHPSFITKQYTDSAIIVATLQEPLIEKAKSYKAEAKVQIMIDNRLQDVKGNIILYFQKDTTTAMPALTYGSQVVFNKPLQPIHNAGNPGGFDYERYCAFHGLYFQAYLKSDDYETTNQKKIVGFRQFLFDLQKHVVKTFKQYIPSKTEAGVANALLIGYKNDLDQDIVQSYSNTGVVHIIAISGMHLGLIYGLLVLMFRPFGNSRKIVYIRAVAIIGMLWVFTLLTGAAPSIVRSAIMFTFLVFGQTKQRKASIYNNLATSAMFILLADPFSLWDVGFQLSYTALLSIAVFASPIGKWFYSPHKWLRKFLELNAVTLSAQILTYPIVVFHFHQFPNLFLLTNLIAVPLSSIILYALIALLFVSWVPFVNVVVGKLCQFLIWTMDATIQAFDKVPFALTQGIYFTIVQAGVLFAFIIAGSWWLFRKSTRACMVAFLSFAVFICLRTYQFTQDASQHRLVVYNVPQHAAVDIIQGNDYAFVGDSILLENNFLQNFHLKPSRVLYQTDRVDSLKNTPITTNAFQLGNKKVLILDHGLAVDSSQIIHADVLIISKNPKLKLAAMVASIKPKIIVVDGTNSRYKIAQWQKEAETLHLRLHSVATDGAFIDNW